MRRQANNDAHCLAKFALSCSNYVVWINDDFPSWLQEFVLTDIRDQ